MAHYLSDELKNTIALYEKNDLTLGKLAQLIWESLPEEGEPSEDPLYEEVTSLIDEFGEDKPVSAFE